MSILIKGMAMPKNCEECPCFDEGFYYCNVKKENLSERLFDHTKDPPPNWCPLVELPSHGDLIDRDALTTVTEMIDGKWKTYIELFEIADAPTIIEAEGEDEMC